MVDHFYVTLKPVNLCVNVILVEYILVDGVGVKDSPIFGPVCVYLVGVSFSNCCCINCHDYKEVV